MFKKTESTSLSSPQGNEVSNHSKVAGLDVGVSRRDFLRIFTRALALSALGGLSISSIACESSKDAPPPRITQNFDPLHYPTLEPEQAIDYPSDPIDSEKAKQVIDLFLKESLFVREEGGDIQTFEIPFDLMVEIQEKEDGTIELVSPTTDFSIPEADEDLKTKINMAIGTGVPLLVDIPVHYPGQISYVFFIAGKELRIDVVGKNSIIFQLQEKKMYIRVEKSLNHSLSTVVNEELSDNTIASSRQLSTQNHSVASTVSISNDDSLTAVNIEEIVIDGNHFDKRIDTIESLQQFISDYSDAPEIIAYMISNHYVEKGMFDPITDVESFKSFVGIFPSNPIIITSALRLVVSTEFLQQIDDIQDFIDMISVLPKDSAVFEILFQKIGKITFKSSDSMEDLIKIISLMPRDAKIFDQFINRVIEFVLKDNGSKDEFRHPINTLSSGWGDCDDYVVLYYFWAYLQNYNPYMADMDAKKSGKLGHIFTWFENEEGRVVILDGDGDPYEGSYRLLNEGETVEDYFAERYQEKYELTDAYIQIS